ncbi:MAG TPA: LPS export ABC transporter periplasmic protein LptC, partial [Candidatus Brocadiales bacterium]|nr:LPS export ABC transporter periplasmic protein LptC [Candidatus Brocadiales bacterium]
MSKRKIIYISITIGCVAALFLSVMGFLPDIFVEREEKEALETVIKKPEQPVKREMEGEEVSQAIEGLYLPTYDEAGKEQLVLRGEHAVFVNNRLYKITNPTIDVYYEEKPSAPITITSLHGEMDKVTNLGILYDNVVIKLSEKMNAYTDNLKYEPDKRRIHTDDAVTIIGERMKVIGKGFVADLTEQNVQIKNDVELDIHGQTSLPLNEVKGLPVPPQSTRITSSGPFVFEKRTNTATFLSSARVTRGTLTLLADNLALHLNPDNGKLTQLVANGNVVASDAPTVAKAKTLTWNATSQIVTLEGDPVAELFERNASIASSKIILRQKDNSIEAPTEGRLVTKLEAKEHGQTSLSMPPSSHVTNITWKGSMSFEKDKHVAMFKKGVEVTKEDSKINCGSLLVNFEADNSSIKTIKATKAVHLLETKDGVKREAKASQVIWEAGGNLVEMVAEPSAWVQEGNRQLTAPYIMLFDNGQKIIGEGPGNLSITESKETTDADNPPQAEALNVSWLDRMVFDQAQQRAFFYGGVKTVKGEHKIDSDQLDVFLSGSNNFDKIIAKGNVYFKDLRKDGIEGIGDIANW